MNHLFSSILSMRWCAAGLALCVAGTTFAGGTLQVPGPLELTIQEAIEIAETLGATELIVAPGTYVENIDFGGRALTLRSQMGAEVTIIDGGAVDQVITCINGEGWDTLIDGFTIRNGKATSTAPNDRGAGLYMNLSNPTVRNCIFESNIAALGAAFYCNGGQPFLADCEFNNNTSTNTGGAFYANNSNLTLLRCEFNSNSTNVRGGAGICYAQAASISHCRFTNNTSNLTGGALQFESGVIALVEFCEFDDNFSGDNDTTGRGGAVHVGLAGINQVTVRHCLFTNNSCSRYGGAVFSQDAVTVQHCTFFGNSAFGPNNGFGAGAIGGSSQNVLVNNIAWNNGAQSVDESIFASYNCVEGGIDGFSGAGNISLEPMFIDAANGNFRLADGSPCIDAGNATAIPTTLAVDFDGATRAVNGSIAESPTGIPVLGVYVDMGAFEFQPNGVPSSCAADIAPPGGNGTVTIDDLIKLINEFGPCP